MVKSMGRPVLLLLITIGALACSAQPQPPLSSTLEPAVDSARVLADLRYLASPALGGRATGTTGNQMAREYIEAALRDAGAEAVGGGAWTQPFGLSPSSRPGKVAGSNVLGMIRGTDRPDRYIVVTAHFDHLGTRDGLIFHGADDNASGSAALLEIARQLGAERPLNSIVFAALDAEELGLQGARAFVADPPVPLEAISLNINLDMIGRSDDGTLYVAGTYHYPFLNSLVDDVAATSELNLLKGHDRPDGSAGDDWTALSDHGAFHAAGIPFLYFGVEDHEDYHRPTDTFENIQPGFFVDAVRAILKLLMLADEGLTQIESASSTTALVSPGSVDSS